MRQDKRAITVVTLIISGVVLMCSQNSSLNRLLPKHLEPWAIAEKDRAYDRNNLYDYIDGGAELFLSYGFEKALARIYTAPNQPDILLDVFDMGNSRNAYGVFSHSREVVENTFGQGSQYTGGLLLFWKDRYYVSILASPETEESKEAVFSIARHINEAVQAKGPLPEILGLLPQESLVEESIRYFRHYIWLNSHYFVAQENILHIEDSTDAVLAKYGDRLKRHILLLIEYPGDAEAAAAMQDFATSYLPELTTQNVVQIEDGTWTACSRRQNHLIIVFNAPEEITAMSLIASVEQKIEAAKKISNIT